MFSQTVATVSVRKSKNAINKSLPYTSKLRSATPMDNNANTARITARLNNYSTPKGIAVEGYRVCRLNLQLCRDLSEAQRKLQSGLMASVRAVKNDGGSAPDVAAIKKRLDSGGSAAEIAAEAYRFCQVNDGPRRQLENMDGQKMEFAVMEDALKETSICGTNCM
jgi:hypothetical protein